MRTADFDFLVPAELVAQIPTARRDQSRLFVVHRNSAKFEHRVFGDLIDYLREGDVLVLNNSRVIPARLRGVNANTGGQYELLLLEENAVNDWWAMLRPGKRAREGTRVTIKDPKGNPTIIEAMIVGKNQEGHGRIRFSGVRNILDRIDQIGEVPLPPYIERVGSTNADQDRDRYQTVFAGPTGSVAAPTAGLHFTEAMLQRICRLGVEVCFVTLHVGLGTFAPVKSEDLAAHIMHEERYELSTETARAIDRAKAGGGRVVAVGTTSLRVLESVARRGHGSLVDGGGRTRLFIHPPYDFKIVDMLLTNFHVPRSTLVMLVSAFAAPGGKGGTELIRRAYAAAIHNRYRFFSYGDAMLLA